MGHRLSRQLSCPGNGHNTDSPYLPMSDQPEITDEYIQARNWVKTSVCLPPPSRSSRFRNGRTGIRHLEVELDGEIGPAIFNDVHFEVEIPGRFPHQPIADITRWRLR